MWMNAMHVTSWVMVENSRRDYKYTNFLKYLSLYINVKWVKLTSKCSRPSMKSFKNRFTIHITAFFAARWSIVPAVDWSFRVPLYYPCFLSYCDIARVLHPGFQYSLRWEGLCFEIVRTIDRVFLAVKTHTGV